MTVDPDEIRFELEHLSVSEPGRLELTGRWFGVRGRRFVRPTLLLTLLEDDVERRALADLEHSPWAAEDGERWTAVFPIDGGIRPEAAATIELSVAPDITIRLRSGPGPGARRRAIRERQTATPMAASQPRGRERDPRSAGERGQAGDSVAGERAAERERVRREDADVERGRAIAERDQAIAERDQAAAERERARAERDQATAERDRAVRVGARAASALREREQELEATKRALAEARAESGRLRAQLTTAQAGQPRAIAGHLDPVRAGLPVPRGDSLGRTEPPASERPRNPSLRSRANWFVRILTVLVMLGVIAAIILVVRMTMKI